MVMLTLDVAKKVLMLNENATELAFGLKFLKAVLLSMHPEHMLFQGIRKKLALA
jgi:hypothetical protein